jgi:Uncharacterized protein conserved in bacteria (DUF2059)
MSARVTATFLFSLPFVVVALGAPDSTVGVSKEVIALREAVPGLNDGNDVGSVIDFFAPMPMRVIGANDPTWKRDNPNWAPVLKLISSDLKKDLGPVVAEQSAQNADRWNRELAAHLSTAQIDQLLAFYHSDVGRRYLAFQKGLLAVQTEGASAIVNGRPSGMDPKKVAGSPPSAAQFEARKQLATLSWIIQVTPPMGTAASVAQGTSADDDKAIRSIIVNALATMRGPELDALRGQYETDLVAFSAFQESAAAKALIAVYGDVTRDAAAESVKPGTAFAAALQESIAQHAPAWKVAYEAGRAGAH